MTSPHAPDPDARRLRALVDALEAARQRTRRATLDEADLRAMAAELGYTDQEWREYVATVEAHHQRGRTLADARNYSRALDALNTAHELAPWKLDLIRDRADVYAELALDADQAPDDRLRHAQAAQDLWTRVLDLAPSDAHAARRLSAVDDILDRQRRHTTELARARNERLLRFGGHAAAAGAVVVLVAVFWAPIMAMLKVVAVIGVLVVIAMFAG